MPRLRCTPPLDPRRLSAAQRDTLTDELFAVQDAVFSGVSRAAFRRYVVDSPARRTRVQVFRDEQGAAVGYAAVHHFHLEVEGRPTVVLRSEVGLKAAWRGQTAAGRLLAQEVFLAMVGNPRARVCFVACPIHPASYLAMARSHDQVWPRPDAATPADVQALLDALDAPLGLERADGGGLHVRKVGWVTRQSADEAVHWASHDHELVRFYLEQNPGYVEGQGLRTAVVLSPVLFVQGLARLAQRQLRRAWRRLTPAPPTVLAAGGAR
jgi:hypothetical protein